MQFPEALLRDVARAIERLNRPGVEGWGLKVFGEMRDAGDLAVLSEHEGCTSDTCAHRSHDEAAPMLRWIPRSGQLIELGSDLEPGEVLVRYYAHLDGTTTRYIRAVEPRFFHAWATYIDVEDVPDWALARLAEEAAV